MNLSRTIKKMNKDKPIKIPMNNKPYFKTSKIS